MEGYGCVHWKSEKDVVALLCPCHREFYLCLLCHKDKYGVAPERWKRDLWECEKAILCRVCEYKMTIEDYMACDSSCTKCGAEFNPGCKDHWPLYFDM